MVHEEDSVGADSFYLRYYVGHKGKFGHEFLEFEFRPDGKLRYANNSNYKKDTMIRKECVVSKAVLEKLRSELTYFLYKLVLKVIKEHQDFKHQD